MTKHPITPPPELVQQWRNEWAQQLEPSGWVQQHIATNAARWGADQELEACCDWIYKLFQRGLEWSKDLRAARRPKPPSLKKLALKALPADIPGLSMRVTLHPDDVALIRRALEALPDD